jgi:hypothetical protein
MMAHPHRNLPLAPLLRAYIAAGPRTVEELAERPEVGPRFRAILTARKIWLYDEFIDGANPEEFMNAVADFYRAVVHLPLHAETLRRRIDLIRHGIAHLARSRDPLPVRLERCLATAGTYYVAGLGPAFWSAVTQALDAQRHPAWTASTMAGLGRCGLARWHAGDSPAAIYAALLATYRRLLTREPSLTALHVDHFLLLAGRMRGRDLWSGADEADPILAVIRQERARCPLRQRLKDRGGQLAEARSQFEGGLRANDVAAVATALRVAASNTPHVVVTEEMLPTLDRLWNADDPLAALADFELALPQHVGRSLVPAVLHLKDAMRFPPFDEATSRRRRPPRRRD